MSLSAPVRLSQAAFLRDTPEQKRKPTISEAIRGYLRSLQKHGEPIPPGIEEEVVEIALG